VHPASAVAFDGLTDVDTRHLSSHGEHRLVDGTSGARHSGSRPARGPALTVRPDGLTLPERTSHVRRRRVRDDVAGYRR